MQPLRVKSSRFSHLNQKKCEVTRMCTISSMLSTPTTKEPKFQTTQRETISLIKAFQRVYDMSKYGAYTELMNIRMREGETIAVFANRYQGLIPASMDPDNELVKYHFINKLPNEVKTLYEERRISTR